MILKKLLTACGSALIGGTAVLACTSAIVGPGATASGRGILWKHRDSGFEQNFIERVEATDSTYAYVALFNGGDSLLTEAWVGVNERSLAVMNTASYNLAPDTARVKDREGLVISEALRRCASIDDFAALLDALPKPLGVQANFGVLDSLGRGAYFETDDYGFVRYDLPADSILIRTNFSCSGTCGDGLGRVRYESACRLLAPHVAAGDVTPRLLTDTVSRSFFRPDLGRDILTDGDADEVEDLDFIPRRSTSASVAIETGPEPAMWVILGYPPLSVARKVTLTDIPEEMRPVLPGAISPLSDRNVRLRRKIIRRHPDGKHYVNLRSLRPRNVTVMQFNVWQEGEMVEGGFEAMADEIARQAPDLLMLSEVRNYRGTRFCDRLTAALAERGLKYHGFYSQDTGVMSRTEITDSATVYPYGDDHGSCYKLITEIDGRRVAAYTAHLDYLNDTYYEPRGYDGNTFRPMAPLTDVEELTRRNLLSLRDEAAREIVADVARERALGSLIFLGGDLNEPSGADWTEATRDMADHRGVVIDWPTLRILADAGLTDAYRSFYPDPVEYPGYTYPCSNPAVEVGKLSWAITADERDRIDYIFYMPDSRLALEGVGIVGPQDDIVRGERTATDWGRCDITAPAGVWPSDHRAVVARFRIR